MLGVLHKLYFHFPAGEIEAYVLIMQESSQKIIPRPRRMSEREKKKSIQWRKRKMIPFNSDRGRTDLFTEFLAYE